MGSLRADERRAQVAGMLPVLIGKLKQVVAIPGPYNGFSVRRPYSQLVMSRCRRS